MRVIIAGSRNLKDYSLVDKATKDSGFDITEVVSGMAPGIDSVGETWAKNNGIPIQPFPAKWDDLTVEKCFIKTNKFNKRYNALAGINRNEEMAEYASALIVIHDGSNGSLDMKKQMEGLGKPVYELKVEGIN